MKFLIAGLGSIGRRHLRNLKALGQEDILLYRTHLATLPDEELAGLPVYTNLSDALAQKPDGVIVSNPTSEHLKVALPAAKAGCNLLIEKPIAANLEGIPELQAALRAHSKQALVGFHFRNHPVLQEIKGILDSEILGKPLSGRVQWGEYLPDWHPWEDYRQSYAARKDLGGGVVNTLSHPFDYLRWLLGDVKQVSALTDRKSSLEIDTEDSADILLRFRGGANVSVHLDYYQRPATHHLSIVCEQGSVYWDNATSEAAIYYAEGQHWQSIKAPQGFERNSMFLDEMKHFIEICQGDVHSQCSLEDGIQAQRIVLAVHRSSAEEGRLVEP